MDTPKLEQTAGDGSELYQAGRDQTFNQPTYIVQPASQPVSNPLKELIDAYKEELKNPQNELSAQFTGKLSFFMNNLDVDLQSLEQKLNDGGFHSDVELALKLKQSYGMMLQQIKHIHSAQKIHAYLLGMVLVNFSHVRVYLTKAEKPDNAFIKDVIKTKVIDPVESLLGATENVMEIYPMDIHAMVYYLTGNCHIKWN